jgi:hypothetical protein
MEHPQVIETAVASYLSANSSFPASLKNSSGTYRIFAGQSDSTKDGQCIICSAGDLTETPPFSVNYWADFSVELRTPITLDATTGTSELASHQAASTVLKDSILDTALAATLSAQVAGLVVYMCVERTAIREESEDFHMSGYRFRVYFCPP